MGRDDRTDLEAGTGDEPPRHAGVGDAAALLPRLLAELPERRARLRRARERAAAADAEGLEALASEAHRLAGAAAYCGAETLHHAASALERAARSADGVRALRLARKADLVIGRLLHPGPTDRSADG